MELVIWFSLGLLLTVLFHYLEYKISGESKVEWVSLVFIICPFLPFLGCMGMIMDKLEGVGPWFVFKKNNSKGD